MSLEFKKVNDPFLNGLTEGERGEIERIREIWGMDPSKFYKTIDKWFGNFQDHSDKHIALKVFKNVDYYSPDRFFERISDLGNQLAQHLWARTETKPKITLVTSKAGFDSSNRHAYDIKKLWNKVEVELASIDDIGNIDSNRFVVCFNDTHGTGNQFMREIWPKLSVHFPEEQVIIVAITIANEALDLFNNKIPGVHVIPQIPAVSVMRLFGKDELSHLQRLGRVVYPSHPLGYGNIGLLTAYYFQCPNNSLPIIWADGSNNESEGYAFPWSALTPYKPKQHPGNAVAPRINLESQAAPSPVSLISFAPQLLLPQTSTGTTRSAEESSGNTRLSASRMPQTEPFLFGRNKELQDLDEAWKDSKIHIVTIVAPPGVGKSALVNYWLYQDRDKRPAGFNGTNAYIWSFYTQGTTERVVSADYFFEASLREFGDNNPSSGSPSEKGRRLARYLKEDETLLVLDGLEPLQNPPGFDEGRLKDRALAVLLNNLAIDYSGLCVITSWMPISELRTHENETVKVINLEYLNPNDGATLLKEIGVNGVQADLEQVSVDFGGHSLALMLFGGMLSEVYGGDIRHKDKIGPLKGDVRLGGHAKRVMETFKNWLSSSDEWINTAQLSLLKILSLFDRPISLDKIEVVTHDPPITGLAEGLQNLSYERWQQVLASLRRRRFLYRADPLSEDVVNTHTLTREYFRDHIVENYPDAWTEGNRRLFQYYQVIAKAYPDTVDGMDPLFQAVICGCNAGEFEAALHDIYIPRIMRGEEYYAASKLGAYVGLLSILSHYFEEGDWSRPTSHLENADRLFLLLESGRYLTAIKGYSAKEVENCYTTAESLAEKYGSHEQKLEVMLGLCRINRLRARLGESGKFAETILKLCVESGEHGLQALGNRALASNYFYTGDFSKANMYAQRGIISNSALMAAKNARLDINDPVVSCIGYSALSLWFLGYPDMAITKCRESVIEARHLEQPHTLAVALLIESMISFFRKEPEAVKRSSEELITVCSDQGFQLWRLSGEIHLSWVHVEQKLTQHSLDKIKNLIAEWQRLTAVLFLPYWQALFADALMMNNEVDRALIQLEKSIELSAKGEFWWLAEILRLKGICLSLTNKKPEARQEFLSALEIARGQEAKSLELRVATNLCRLLYELGEKSEAKYILVETLDGWPGEVGSLDYAEANELLQFL